MIQLQKNSASHLISAYNLMMKEMQNAFVKTNPVDMSLQKALEMAKHQAIHLGEVSAEEAHELSKYIKRDINDAAEYMMETSAEFYDWLMLDIEVVERKVMDMFLSVADHTRIELEQFKQEKTSSTLSPAEQNSKNQPPLYKSGEITGPGTLICERCGEVNPFISSDEITDCKKCGNSYFIRRQHDSN
jgi:hypothetical protein